MSELLPTIQAEQVQEALLDYLLTTFALADEDARGALGDFLEDSENGMFKGPYVRLRLPFRAAADGWRNSLEWYEGFPPYGHQAAAFQRLTSLDLGPSKPRPLPTLVTTGTGSGKTESFLIPLLDHVRRAKRQGVTGVKAIILYPMNALANDQAKRLTGMLTTQPELQGITAALFTGHDGPQRTSVTADGLITERAVIRSSPPDLLLTNYKMLDHLLLRSEDAGIWAKSAHSLQYLVLDEFHTYDGAQGTDVSMLLRRLGLTIKSYWTDTDPYSEQDRARPLGMITPVATSATLGDGGDPSAMLSFAETVFGETFPADSVVTESRLTAAEWMGDHWYQVGERGYSAVKLNPYVVAGVNQAVKDLGAAGTGRALTEAVLAQLFTVDGLAPSLSGVEDAELLDLFRAHPSTRVLIENAADAIRLDDLVGRVLGAESAAGPALAQGQTFLTAVFAALSHLRAVVGRSALSVDLHLWVREVSRIDRLVSDTPRYHWSDDGPLIAGAAADATVEDSPLYLPAIFCRHCGRSGWGICLAPTGYDLDDLETIRRRKARNDDRFRPLVFAPAEGERALQSERQSENGLLWLAVAERRLLATESVDEAQVRSGAVVPVLTHTDLEAGESSQEDVCPSCLTKDGIRFLGSAIATLLSVTMSTVFGDENLDVAEKRALVFTDSVQDAAHRAGFVQSRSHSLTFRSVIRDAVGDDPVSLADLVPALLDRAGADPHRRYRLLHPSIADDEQFSPFWSAPQDKAAARKLKTRLERRLLFDAQMEFGLNSRTGRTLERTGSVTAEVEVPYALLLRAADQAIEEAGGLGQLDIGGWSPDEHRRVAWVRGVLERMREQGALAHPWFAKYQQEDGNRYWIWGGRKRAEGMPAFPTGEHGRPAPAYPRVGGARSNGSENLDAVTSPKSWYAQWASRVLGVHRADGGKLARLLLQRLDQLDVLDTMTTDSGGKVYEVPAASVLLHPVTDEHLGDGPDGWPVLVCGVCRNVVPTSRTVAEQLDGAPCTAARCEGTLVRSPRRKNFYRTLYGSTDIRRVVAREHTSMLEDRVRLSYEEAFKRASDDPQAPNVLVATPTLEMGIDIGDLSTVMLSSLPKSVASYLQRVGRAGRLTGNALDLAFVTGRGDQLPRLGEPTSLINGAVRAPATYLDAEEILRRQFTAHLADVIARRPGTATPRWASEGIGSTEPGSYLRLLLDLATTEGAARVEEFLAGFGSLDPETADELRRWLRDVDDAPGTSPFARRVHEASVRWNASIEAATYRLQAIEQALPGLEQAVYLDEVDAEGQRKDRPTANDSDRLALRTARAARRLAQAELKELRTGYWIGVLEEFGLFPNYTLLGDSVVLDVTLSWLDPDTGTFENEPFSLRRGGTQALRDFAPGAHFYTGGRRLMVDALDLGHDQDAVHQWALCPSCGHVAGPDPQVVGSCPRCGGAGIADTRQRIDVVELERVFSAMRREDSIISDDRDERMRQQFTVLTLADVDPTKIRKQWFVKGYPFGARYLRDQTIRWMNLGPTTSRAAARPISGDEVETPLFRVCERCGQLDTNPRANRPDEHRPWCEHRNDLTHHVREVALTRTLTTEGLVLRLPPSVTVGDAFALPSLKAAILLGLREIIGGAPDHLQIVETQDPNFSEGREISPALLLHDVVPGGTGYLADLAAPQGVWDVLRAAWEVVRSCPCEQEDRIACYRCVLPYAAPHEVRWVSRAAAARHLEELLTVGTGIDPEVGLADQHQWAWDETEPGPSDPESTLEQRFRQVFLERITALGTKVNEQPTGTGNRYTFTVGGRGWTLEPQQITGGVKPDFMLRCTVPGVPETAIFTDGRRWHAHPLTNRIADDATKRAALRLDRIVLALTWPDLDAAQKGTVPPPTWWDPDLAEEHMLSSAGKLSPTSFANVVGGPMDQLAAWIQNPDRTALSALADWVPMFLVGAENQVALDPGASLRDVAAGVLQGTSLPEGDAPGWIWRYGAAVLVARLDDPATNAVSAALLLDDRDEALAVDTHRKAWQEWLRLSNLLNLRGATTIDALSNQHAEPPAGSTAVVQSLSGPDITAAWKELLDLATADERPHLLTYAAADLDLPELGEETEGGLPLAISWADRRVVVDVFLDTGDRIELEHSGWHVVAPDLDAVRAALAAGKG